MGPGSESLWEERLKDLFCSQTFQVSVGVSRFFCLDRSLGHAAAVGEFSDVMQKALPWLSRMLHSRTFLLTGGSEVRDSEGWLWIQVNWVLIPTLLEPAGDLEGMV